MTAVAEPPLQDQDDRYDEGPEPRNERASRLAMGWMALIGAAGIASFLISANAIIGIVLIALAAGIAVFFFARSRAVGYVQLMAVFVHFETLGSRTFTPGRILAVVTLLLVAYRFLAKRERFPALPRRFVIVVSLLITWIWISGAWAVEASRWAQALLALAVGFAYFLAFAFFLQGPNQLRRALRVYWIAGIVTGLLTTIAGLLLGGRAVGFTGDPNIFVMYQSSLLPLTLYFAQAETVRWRRMLHFVALATVSGASIVAASRSGIICVSITLTVCFFVFGRGSVVRKTASAGAGAVMAMMVFAVGILLNPAFLERGLNDRGGGRLDVWLVARRMIGEKPFHGQGAGNFASVSIQRLIVTPGVELTDANTILSQKEIGAHNVWLEVMANLGLVGVTLFATILGLTALAFILPRRVEWKRLHTTLAIMLLALLVSTQFFGADTNKLLWMLVGTAALLHTPDRAERYAPRARRSMTPVPAAGSALVPAGAAPDPDPIPGALLPPASPLDEARTLSRIELRSTRRVKALLFAGGIAFALAVQLVLNSMPHRYTATDGVYIPDLENVGVGVGVNDVRVRTINNILLSEAYAERLGREAGLEAPPERILGALTTRRAFNGAYVAVTFTWPEQEEVRRVASLLIPVLDRMVEEVREEVTPAVEVALRPTMPLEVADYQGPLYLRAFDEAVLGEVRPQFMVDSIIFFGGGVLFAGALLLIRAVQPVVADGLVGYTLQTRVWGRLGRRGGWRSGVDRSLAVAASIVDDTGGAPSRLAITSVTRRARRQVALDLAGSLAVTGQPVLIVDADPDRPAFGRRRRGWAQVTTGAAELEEVARPLPRWRWLHGAIRPPLDHGDNIRIVGPGRMAAGDIVRAGGVALDVLPPGTMTIYLLPRPGGRRSVAEVIGSADATVVVLESGWTLLSEAEDITEFCRLLAPSWGVVTVDF